MATDASYRMATDEEKAKLAKLLQGIEIPEVKLSERCSDLVKDFQQKFGQEVESEEQEKVTKDDEHENPYKVDRALIEEVNRKLQELLLEGKRAKKESADSIVMTGCDPKRPWRTNSSKEKLLRIENEIKRHHEKGNEMITPLADGVMKELVNECQEETRNARPVPAEMLRNTVNAAKKNLPNFQYRKIENSTATAILPDAHVESQAESQDKSSGQYIPRPPSKQCFLRSLGELRNLRLLALEYSHIADGTGGALIALLPVIKRPHFRLQLICREDHTPGRADAALGVGGYGIPDTAWRRVTLACPNLYLLMAFFRVRDYDNIRRFLTPSIPLKETHLQLGIDLKMAQRQDSDISCFIRHIAYYFGNSLGILSIHQWRFATFPLRRVFELMPHLVRFIYVGRVDDEVDLRRMLQIVACGVCDKLKQINIQIQDEDARRDYWQQVVATLTEEYEEIMKLYDILFCLSIYKS